MLCRAGRVFGRGADRSRTEFMDARKGRVLYLPRNGWQGGAYRISVRVFHGSGRRRVDCQPDPDKR